MDGLLLITNSNAQSVEDLCRICLEKDGSISIFSLVTKENKLIDLLEVFEVCTNLKLTENDGLPKKMCTKCFFSLLKVHKFILKCKASDSILRSGKLLKNEITVENVNSLKSEMILIGADQEYIEEFESQQTDTKTKLHKCKECFETFPSDNKLMKHITQSHIEMHVCNLCKTGFSHSEELRLHIEKNHGDDNMKCSHCNQIHASRHEMHQHMMARHQKCVTKFVCDVCGVILKSRVTLQTHYRLHTGEKPYKCNICQRQFSQITGYKRHKFLHTGQKPHVCEACGKTFAHRGDLKRHFFVHNINKKVSCSVCKRQFATKWRLKTHMRTHTGEKVPHSCSVCSKNYYSIANFKMHMEEHADPQKARLAFVCSVCNRQFRSVLSLKRHTTKVHLVGPPFVCSICEKKFETTTALRSHTRAHEEGPQQCFICKKVYSFHCLRKHVLTHNVGSHSCDICTKTFFSEVSVKLHMKRAHKEKS